MLSTTPTNATGAAWTLPPLGAEVAGADTAAHALSNTAARTRTIRIERETCFIIYLFLDLDLDVLHLISRQWIEKVTDALYQYRKLEKMIFFQMIYWVT
jgi:hypothetical protein